MKPQFYGQSMSEFYYKISLSRPMWKAHRHTQFTVLGDSISIVSSQLLL